jgi:hypothetical protein
MRTTTGWHGGPTTFAVRRGRLAHDKDGSHLSATGRVSMRTMVAWHVGPTSFAVHLRVWRTAKILFAVRNGNGARQRGYNEFYVFIIMHKYLNGCKNYHKLT